MAKLPAIRPDKLPASRPSVALALGGGGARGLAHIVALEAFEALGVRPVAMAGTSIGALLGGGYASGLRAADLRALATETLSLRFDLVRQLFAARASPVQKLLNVLPLRSALLDPEALLELVMPSRVARRFEELLIPFSVVATDLASAEQVVFTSGDLRPAIAASIAIPFLFQPVKLDGRPLQDGGLVNPLPFDLLHGAADIVVAIDVSGASKPAEFRGGHPSMLEVLMQSVQILEKSITREKLRSRAPDIYIDVDLDRFGALEFHKAPDILAAAAPVGELLRRRLEKVLSSETVAPPATKRG